MASIKPTFATTAQRLAGFAAGAGISALLRALMLPLSAWLILPQELAKFSLWQLALGLLVMACSVGLPHAVTREFHGLDPDEQPLLLAHVLWVQLVTSIVSAAIIILAYVIGRMDALPLAMLAAAIPVQLAQGAVTLYLRLEQRTAAFAATQIGSTLLWLLVLLVAFFTVRRAGLALERLLMLWLVAQAVQLGWLAWLMWSALQVAWQQRGVWFSGSWRKRLRAMFLYGRPLLLSESLYLGMGVLGAVLLTRWHGLETMAVYAMAMSIGSLGSLFGQVFNTVWLPEVYRAHAQSGHVPWLGRSAQRIVWAAFALLVLTTFGGFVAVRLLPTHYDGVKWLVAAAVAKPMLMNLQRVTAIGIELERQTWVSPLAMALAFALQVVLAWWLIPQRAAAGAVLSQLWSAWAFWQIKSLAADWLWRPVVARPAQSIYAPLLIALLGATLLALRFPSP